MSLRRSLPWSAAIRVVRNERLAPAPALTVAGSFDKSAIMQAAVRRARGLRASGLSWARRMSIALRFVWAEAKRALAAPAARAA